MIRSNEHYAGLPGAYLFATVVARVRAHREQHPALPVISCGSVCSSYRCLRPICPSIHMVAGCPLKFCQP